MPEFGRKVPHLRCDSHTSFKLKESKVRVTRPINADTHRATYLPHGKAHELQTWSISQSIMRYYYAPVRREGGRKRYFCPSICPSVAYIANNSRSKGLACPNLEGRFINLNATRTPVSRSNGERSWSPGPLTLTHIVRHIYRKARPTNFKLGIRIYTKLCLCLWLMEDDDPHQPQAP